MSKKRKKGGGTPLTRTGANTYSEALKALRTERGESAFRETLKFLPEKEREAMVLVVSGFSTAEAAQISGCDIKIFRNRVRAGRRRMAEILSIEDAGDFRPDTDKADQIALKVIEPTKDDQPDPPKIAEFILTALGPVDIRIHDGDSPRIGKLIQG